QGRYFDVLAEYAKKSPDDVLIRVTVGNRGPDAARLHVLPTIWARNVWSWGCKEEGYGVHPRLRGEKGGISIDHPTLGALRLDAASGPELLFTENETSFAHVFGSEGPASYARDAFHEYVVRGKKDAVNPAREGSKAAALYVLDVPAGAEVA